MRLSDEALDDLELKLAIAASKLIPGEQRIVRGPGPPERTTTPPRSDLQGIVADITHAYRTGVSIAPHAESRPLLPLFEAAKVELPPQLQVDHQQMGYDFYSVEVTFSSLLARDQFLLEAVLDVELSDDVPRPERQTRPIQLFPGRKDIQLFRVDLEGAVGIDAGLNVTVPTVNDALLPFGTLNADAKARVKAGIIVGPFQFPFRRAALEVRGESDPHVTWRYNLQSQLTGTNEFKSLLILKVAAEARSVSMAVSLDVVPCKRRWLVFKDLLPSMKRQAELPVELAQGGIG